MAQAYSSGGGSATGYKSTLGNQNTASGNYSFAAGWGSQASGQTSFALGYYSKSEGLNSMALGMYTRSQVAYSITIGRGLSNTKPLSNTTYSYDALGRMTSRTDEDGITTWQYDQQLAGFLDQTSYAPTANSGPSVRELFEYDGLGRLTHHKQFLSREASPRVFTYEYNKNGQRESITYPSGYAITYRYDTNGNMITVKNSKDGSVLWSAASNDKFGNITDFTLGNNIIVSQTYDSLTGLVTNLSAMNNRIIQDLKYNWNDHGNLTERYDLVYNHNEKFSYDNFNRLTNIEIDEDNSRDIVYNNLGNISFKYDAGTMEYHPANPYALRRIMHMPSIASFGDTQDVIYTSFDKVKSVSQGAKSLDISYGADRQRVWQVLGDGNSTQTKQYFTPLYEEVTEGGVTKRIHYLTASTGLFAIFALDTNNNGTMSYVIKDHQGSMYATVTGNTVERYSFDAWGRRRNPQTLSYDNVTASFDRGYTLHEHYDDFGLINMNGRLYDPLVGRMLSPDIVIQDEQNSQAYNRYSYCFNNPLRFTDPSGYISVGGFRNRTSTLLYFDYWGTNSNTRSSFSTDESLGNQIPVDDWFENEETGEIYYNVNMHQGDEGTGAMKGSGWKWLGPNGMFCEGLFNSDMSLVARNNGIIDIDADGNFNMEMMLREEKAKALMASVGYKQVNKQEIVYSSTYTQSISDGRHSFRFTYGTSATYSEKVCYVPNGFDEISRVQLGKTLYGNINQATGAFPEVSRYSISYGNLSFWRKVGKAMKIGTGIHDYVNYYDGGSVKSYYESGALNSLINDFLRKYPK